MQRDTKKNYQLYGRNDMIMLDEHNKIYGSLGLAEPYIVATKEGETLLLNGAKDNEPFIGLSLYGKSHQNTVAGNQLIPMTVGEEIVSENGFVSATCTEDGVNIEAIVGASVQAHSDIYFIGTGSTVDDYEAYPDFEAGKTYIVRCDSLNYSLYVSALRDGGMVTLCHSDDTVGNGTFTPEEGDTFRVFLRPRKVYTEPENEVVHVMISSNMDAPIWEPYTGGQPSPNPNYPQEIEITGKDGEIGVDVYGGNLYDESDESLYLNGYYINAGVLTPASNNYGFCILLPPGNYVYTQMSVNTDVAVCAFSEFPQSGATATWEKFTAVGSEVKAEFTVAEDAQYVFVKYTHSIAETKSPDEIKRSIMLNAGSTALPFEPYKQPQSLTVSTPNGLPGIPVSSGGNYTDENGQQWISDEVDYRRRKYVKRTELLRITDFSEISNPMHTDLGNTECNIQILGHYPDVQNMSHVNRSMCDSFIYSAIGDYERFAIGSDTELRVYFTLNGVLSREEFIAKMEEISPTILFPLATPIETDLTPEQITAYQSLHTNYPTTTVTNDEGAGMKAIYKQIENGG